MTFDKKVSQQFNLLSISAEEMGVFLLDELEKGVLGDQSFMEKLVAFGADLTQRDVHGQTVLMIAVQSSHPIAKVLVRHGMGVLDMQDMLGFTPLMHAIYYGQNEMIDMLLKEDANVFIRENRGLTAKELAQRLNRDDIVKKLERAEAKQALYRSASGPATPPPVNKHAP